LYLLLRICSCTSIKDIRHLIKLSFNTPKPTRGLDALSPLICCGTVTSCFLLKLSKPGLWSSAGLLCSSASLLSYKYVLSLLLYQLLE
jgi:hypothetical protein